MVTALIWPEHKRFAGYGSNWGKVLAVKAEEVDGKMRLFAKLEPNQYLLEANKLGQKLFTSIEPNPDYKGQGKCYRYKRLFLFIHVLTLIFDKPIV